MLLLLVVLQKIVDVSHALVPCIPPACDHQPDVGPNISAASPGSVNGRHKAGGVRTPEDVCIDPHGPVDASALVLLVENIQRQTHRVQSFKIQLHGCR